MQINPLLWVRFMETFFWNSPWPAESLKTIKPFDGIFWGPLNYAICICNYTSVFDRNLGYYSQDGLEDNGQLLPWNQSTSGLQQSRLISRISSCRNCWFQTVWLSLWFNFDVAVYTALVLAMDCHISLLPARPYFSAEYPRWRALTGSGDNVTISCKYCCRS